MYVCMCISLHTYVHRQKLLGVMRTATFNFESGSSSSDEVQVAVMWLHDNAERLVTLPLGIALAIGSYRTRRSFPPRSNYFC